MSNSARSISDARVISSLPSAWTADWIRMSALALVVAAPIAITPWGTDAYHQPKALVLYGLTAGILLAWLASHATRQPVRWRVTAPETALWAYLLAVLISSVLSVHLRLTLFGAPGRYEGLLAVAAYAVLFFSGAHVFGSPEGFVRLARTAAITGAVLAAYAVAQAFLPPLFQGEAVVRSWYGGLGIARSVSTLGSPVSLGGYLALLLPIMLGFAMTVRNGRLWYLAAGLGVIALLLTLTRGAWAAASAAIVVLVVSERAIRRRAPVAALAIAVAIGIALLAGHVASPTAVAERAASAAAVQSGSLASRIYIWQQTAGLILQRPWTGWGLETLREVFPYDRPALVRTFGVRPVIIDKAHNDILQVAVSTGIPGAAAYVWLWVSLFVVAVRLLRTAPPRDRTMAAAWLAGLTAYALQAQFAFSVVGVAPVWWVLAGAASGWEAASR